ncbi:Imidazolonepropionase [Candidatus Izimaplasma bacterium HR1]|jgi:imidazolonepropionase-like amidohydrolase|uniref:amidohydrolase n=1 Tax=Candidatus Izimoplasma sp. HR1 TaxID=1541959 RepID=UPI0004F86849|nr:Imidazolonepropionase [Candidatus Izimaplasma bacterium HR1]
MLVIKNALLFTVTNENNVLGSIVIENGKILEVGSKVDLKKYKKAEVIDAKGKIVTPGLVDPHCHIGVMEEGIQFEGNDTNEMSGPIYPELRGIDSINPKDMAFEYTYKAGVTSVNTGPGSANIIGGTFTAIKTYGETVDEMIIKEETCMKMALGENPKRVYGTSNKNPGTRMASAALMREWLFKAKDYHKKYNSFINKEKDAKEPPFDMKLHSLMRVYDGMIVKIHAHRADDIMTAIRISNEFDLNVTIDHATEAYMIPRQIKESNTKLIIGPTLGMASKYELVNKSFKSAKVLEDNNIDFAIMTDHPIITLDTTLVQAALFIKEGLSEKTALEALTYTSAKLNGIENRVGSLEVGKDADIVIWDGPLFDIMTRTEVVIIDGKVAHTK